MWMQKKGKNTGFSIVEMMVVIVIIGLLGTLALSRYYAFIARSRQAEAKMNLKTIGDLQEAWKYEKESYNALTNTNGVGAFGSNATNQCDPGNTNGKYMKNELGFRPKDCQNLRYGYHWTTEEATAESTPQASRRIYPDCDKIDKWEKTFKKGELSNPSDIIKQCDN